MNIKDRVNVLSDMVTKHQVYYDHMIEQVTYSIYDTWYKGGKVYVAGNGGSASQSEHFVAELVGTFKDKIEPISAISLTSNSSVITAIANDFGYEEVFSRQIDGLVDEKDLVVLFTTSGSSKNIIRAAAMANFIGAYVISFVGQNCDPALSNYSDSLVQVMSIDTPTIQEAHLMLIHSICEGLEEYR
jgi:D-sedoheptulose 7-phosphate isomerase